jgi:NhaA family Na+:H+ antiporter
VSEHHAHITWARSERFVPRAFIRPILRFADTEASSGIVLVAAAAFALVWANVAADSYSTVFQTVFRLDFGPLHFEETFHELINDGLMAVFFFVVGLEIKRELVVGELRDPKAAMLPVFAALGGMVGPAIIYLAVAGGSGEAGRGWGIPMATDIAFAVGVLTLVGRRAPAAAKLFLLTLAIADDIGAIVVIALVYTRDLSMPWIAAALVGLLGIWGASRAGVRSLSFYAPAALVVWFATLESGVHATLAGVAVGLLTPARPFYELDEFHRRGRPVLDSLLTEDDDVIERERVDHTLLTMADVSRESVAPLTRLLHHLETWSSFGVVPLFALANAGVDFGGGSGSQTGAGRVGLAVALGLVAGKFLGISAFTQAAMKLGPGRLPAGMTLRHLLGVACVAGIGFTVSLFITDLAFSNPGLIEASKVGVFAASALAAIGGWLILRSAPAAPEEQ